VANMLNEMNVFLAENNMPIPSELNPQYDEQTDKRLQADVRNVSPPESSTEEEWYRVLNFID